MSEEEILQGIDDLKHTGCLTDYGIKIINGFLDLYTKEKDEVLHWKGQYYLLSRKIGVISENKITKRIEEIKKIFPNDIMFTREFLITELKGLLEE